MAPIDEKGAIWAFDLTCTSWTLLQPADAAAPVPLARSYHCSASDGFRTIFIHAGCPADGSLSDLWMFDIQSRTWRQGANAPTPPRGGTSIAYSSGKVYRMNGFDGKVEQGGAVDVYDVAANTWSGLEFRANGQGGPEPRSVCALLSLRVLHREKLLTLFGERDPSALGHTGAGRILDDVWIFDVTEESWTKLQTSSADKLPEPRGWFDVDVATATDENDCVIVHGGLSESNARLGDVWVLSF